MKKIVKLICSCMVLALLAFAALLAYLTVNEYTPEATEEILLEKHGGAPLKLNQNFKIMTWNLGYGALGDNADFFMDGGKMVDTASDERVRYNLNGIIDTIGEVNPDILIVQEIDTNSARSHAINEYEYLKNNSASYVFKNQSIFSYNFLVPFIPYPIPPIGKVESGIATYSAFKIDEAARIRLPSPFKWPVRIANLKRCLQISRMPIENSDKEFVLINLHLEAFDNGEGKIAQTNVLKEVIKAELDKGNYVVAGGDFNQVFSNTDVSKYPSIEGNWQPGKINVTEFDKRLTFVTDTTNPTCRSLIKVYTDVDNKSPDKFQYYMIDGFIVSENVEIKNVRTHNTDFRYADHNPVSIELNLLSNS